MWKWIIAAVAGLFIYQKVQANNAASAKAANGITTNPLATFWSGITSQAASLQNSATQNATTKASSILSGLFSSIGGGGAKGANSPATAGSGTQAPSAAQVSNATTMMASPTDDTGDDYGGDGGEDYGGDDSDATDS